jgi:hypothetical protein
MFFNSQLWFLNKLTKACKPLSTKLLTSLIAWDIGLIYASRIPGPILNIFPYFLVHYCKWLIKTQTYILLAKFASTQMTETYNCNCFKLLNFCCSHEQRGYIFTMYNLYSFVNFCGFTRLPMLKIVFIIL